MDEVETVVDLMNEYIDNNIEFLPKEWFLSEMMHQLQAVIEEHFGPLPEEVYTFALLMCTKGRTSYTLPPSTPSLERLRAIPQAEQRSKEWHEFRHKLITASVVHKALGTPSQVRELIRTKKQPYTFIEDGNFEGPRHWGVKYEPISVQYYEYTHQTVVEEFGCILHPTYPFLAASPDGINAKEGHPLFGRMLEIKNPFSREINGNPKEEYWKQCQLQMEVCDLPGCDFLETKFIEYASEEEFRADGTFQRTEDGKYKGIFYQTFTDKVGYVYPPFQCTEEEFTEWSKTNLTDGWINTIYWKLDVVSTVLIGRQKKWFEHVLPQLIEVSQQIKT